MVSWKIHTLALPSLTSFLSTSSLLPPNKSRVIISILLCSRHYARASQKVLVVKNLPANAREAREAGLNLGQEDPWKRAWQPTPVLLPVHGILHGEWEIEAAAPAECVRSPSLLDRVDSVTPGVCFLPLIYLIMVTCLCDGATSLSPPRQAGKTFPHLASAALPPLCGEE